jgi:hypothetical protein
LTFSRFDESDKEFEEKEQAYIENIKQSVSDPTDFTYASRKHIIENISKADILNYLEEIRIYFNGLF